VVIPDAGSGPLVRRRPLQQAATAVGGDSVPMGRPAPATAPESRAPRPLVTGWAANDPVLVTWCGRLVLTLALALLAAKLAAMPLWSWDHYAIWGVKAERLVDGGHLQLDFLAEPELLYMRPDYPLGLPMAWRVAALGAAPGAAGYKLLHGTFALALLAFLHRGLARLAGPAAATVLTAWTAAMPLFWDSTYVGIAELPLALWATAVAVLLLEGGAGAAPWATGLVLGFLPWIKQEGAALALLLLAAAPWLLPQLGRRDRRHRLVSIAIGAAFLALLGAGVAATQLARGVGFLSGDPLARLGERLPQAGHLLAYMGRELVRPAALGLWPLAAVAAAVALWRRRHRALALAVVPGAQLALYTAITFAVYLPPEMHVDAAYGRIAGSLAPLAVLAVAAALLPAAGRTPAARMTP
jgi:hypothetical protein